MLTGIVALLTGCATVPGHPIPQQNQLPFYAAVSDLVTQSVGHYTSSIPGLGSTWDMRATTGGEAIGSVTSAGQKSDALTVSGRNYVKPPASAVQSALPSNVSADSVTGKWLTGSDGLTAGIPTGSWSPITIGAALLDALERTADFPRYGAPTVQIGSEQALEVATPIGTLAVSANEPYHVLRLTPASPDLATTPTRTPAPTPTDTDEPDPTTTQADPGGSQPAAPTTEQSPLSTDYGPIDFVPMSPADIDRTFADLITQTQSLGDAVDLGINFNFSQTGNLDCNDSSCTVTANATTSTTAKRGAKLSGNVTVSMTSTVTVDDRPAGGCSQTGSLPVNGSGVLSCVVGGVAPVVAQIKSEYQAKANAQARASGRDVSLPYTLHFASHTDLRAIALIQAEIDQAVGAERAEQADTNRLTPCPKNSFVADTPVLMADGTHRPIEDIRPGDEIRNAAAGSDPSSHRVTDIHVTDADHDFVRLTVSGPDGIGTIESTAAHLFYNATAATWTEAAALTPGLLLRTPTGTAVVESIETYSATARTFNLSIDGVPTYFVLAANTPVLVHNCTTGQIPYNSDELSRAALRARIKNDWSKGRNVAVARVPGWNDPEWGDLVIGFSKGSKNGKAFHSEDDILDKLSARGIDPKTITALYSERQPCPEKCEGMLENSLAPGTPVTWSVPWPRNPTMRKSWDELLAQMIEKAGG
ncbi:nucleic acid/nucleotide deaminase domain-containing protein [Nocardia terrae]|uniref:nucleic acid/nucleotide deaminase domain-containing protein n=1 Tax=Nocardia terrae TaxID=2675851 RepID=UPI0018E0422A|nr:nucleic acid/nucleotide deaminase domain-containing protein [Nocardia terrae]